MLDTSARWQATTVQFTLARLSNPLNSAILTSGVELREEKRGRVEGRQLVEELWWTWPVLSIAGEKASAAILGPQMKLVATDVTVIDLEGTGHWLMEERPKETMDALIAFL